MAQFDIIEQLRLLDTIGGGGTDVLGRAPATPMTNSITPVPGLAEQQQPQNDVLAQLLPESAKLSKTSAITNSLADAINGLLAVSQGRSPGPSNTQRALQQKQEQLNNEFIAKQRQAQEATRKGEMTEDKSDRAAEIADDRSFSARQAREKLRQTLDSEERLMLHQKSLAKIKGDQSIELETLRQRGDEGAAYKLELDRLKQEAAVAKDLRKRTIDIKFDLPQLLEKMDPATIRETYEDAVASEGLSESASEDALLFFELKVGQLLDQVEADRAQKAEAAALAKQEAADALRFENLPGTIAGGVLGGVGRAPGGLGIQDLLQLIGSKPKDSRQGIPDVLPRQSGR